jgi:hypothetical protein
MFIKSIYNLIRKEDLHFKNESARSGILIRFGFPNPQNNTILRNTNTQNNIILGIINIENITIIRINTA